MHTQLITYVNVPACWFYIYIYLTLITVIGENTFLTTYVNWMLLPVVRGGYYRSWAGFVPDNQKKV